MRGRLAGVGSVPGSLLDRPVEEAARILNKTSRTYSEAIDRTEALATGALAGPSETQPDPRAAASLSPELRKKLARIRVLVDAFWED